MQETNKKRKNRNHALIYPNFILYKPVWSQFIKWIVASVHKMFFLVLCANATTERILKKCVHHVKKWFLATKS